MNDEKAQSRLALCWSILICKLLLVTAWHRYILLGFPAIIQLEVGLWQFAQFPNEIGHTHGIMML